MNRRLRKHPQHHAGQVERESPTGKRFPFGLMWLVLTVLVLGLVLWYDHRATKAGEQHIALGKELEQKGMYVEALDEYQDALANNRLGRKAKAGVAVSMAEIYFNNMEDYVDANKYYVQARQTASAVMNNKDLQDHARLAATRAKQSGTFAMKPKSSEKPTTHTIVQRVELLQMPAADSKGPIVATYNGGEIHAGEVLRALEKRPEFLRPDFREDPSKLKAFIDGIIREDLAYQAAVSAGIHKDPDVSERLYDYQKNLVTQRYMVDRREQAMVVDNPLVESYYREHVSEYVQPGSLNLSVIKSDSETSAAAYLQMLRDGHRFEDVATSFSAHKPSSAHGGDIGTLTEKDTTIPGIGEAPQVIEALFKLPVYSVTEVTPIAGAYYIFKITGISPARNTTVDEARGSIENILRGRAVDQARTGLDAELKEAFDPQVDQKSLEKFWDFARDEGRLGDITTSATVRNTSTSSTITVSGTAGSSTSQQERK